MRLTWGFADSDSRKPLIVSERLAHYLRTGQSRTRLATGPGLRATVTNLVTGASVDLPVNGSMRISPQTPVGTEGHYVEVMTFSGPTINLSPGQLTWFTGRKVIVTEYDQSCNIVTQTTSQTGPSLDVCAALAR